MRRSMLLLALAAVWVIGAHPASAAPAAEAPAGGGRDHHDDARLPDEHWPAVKFRAKVVEVIHGDSMKALRDGTTVTIRLHGIDCPDRGKPHGDDAAAFTEKAVLGREVTAVVRGDDKYHRIVAEVFLENGKNLNHELLRLGHAWWYRQYSHEAILLKLESEARDKRRGVWRSWPSRKTR